MPLKDQYTLIERTNTLIEQSDHLATEPRIISSIGVRSIRAFNRAL